MDDKKRKNILHDINAIFDSVVYEECGSNNHWIEIHLAEGNQLIRILDEMEDKMSKDENLWKPTSTNS